MPMQDSTALAFEQAFAKSHFVGLAQQDRENQGMGFVAEQSRLGFLAAAQEQIALAGGILAQRSAENQPNQASGIAGSKAVSG